MSPVGMRETRPGVWEIRIFVGTDPVTHKKKMLSKTFEGGERQAVKFRASLLADLDRDGIGSSRASIAYLLREWMRLQEKEGRSPSTLRTYQGYIDNWILPAIGQMRLDRLTAGDLRKLYASMTDAPPLRKGAPKGRRPATVRQVRAIVSSALSFAVESGWTYRNVGRQSRAPKAVPSTLTIPTLTETLSLIAAARELDDHLQLATCILLAAATGARAGELCGLRFSDVTRSTISIERSVYAPKEQPAALKSTKTHAKRTIAIDPRVVDGLALRLSVMTDWAERIGCELVEDPYVLSRLSDGSGPPRPDGYSSSFGRLRDELGLKHVHLHSLRHLNASQMIGKGINPRTAATRLGHSDPSLTLRVYSHALPEADQAAAELMGNLLGELPP
jgi:integrase